MIYGEKNDRLLSQYTEAIYGLRFAPYMIVLLCIRARRYTIVIRDHVIRPNTVVYGEIRTVYGRLRAYTDSVIVDLGGNKMGMFRVIFVLIYFSELFIPMLFILMYVQYV